MSKCGHQICKEANYAMGFLALIFLGIMLFMLGTAYVEHINYIAEQSLGVKR